MSNYPLLVCFTRPFMFLDLFCFPYFSGFLMLSNISFRFIRISKDTDKSIVYLSLLLTALFHDSTFWLNSLFHLYSASAFSFLCSVLLFPILFCYISFEYSFRLYDAYPCSSFSYKRLCATWQFVSARHKLMIW